MMEILTQKSGSGRTTKQLRAAIDLARQGKEVYYLVEDKSLCDAFMAAALMFIIQGEVQSEIKNRTLIFQSALGSIAFRSKDYNIRGEDENTYVVYDHSVVERIIADYPLTPTQVC